MVSALALLGACGDDDGGAGGPSGGCREAVDGEVTIAADAMAWDVDCLSVPADEPVTIVIDNRDEGVNHNLTLRDAPGSPRTALEKGPVEQRLEVTLAAGEYDYVCDIHPNMVGTLHAVTADGADERDATGAG